MNIKKPYEAIDILGSKGSLADVSENFPQYLVLLVLLLISFSEFHTISLIQAGNLDSQAWQASGIVHGTPWIRVFQSRILGPYFVQAIATVIKHSYLAAYKIALFILLGLSTCICYDLVRRIRNRPYDGLIWAAVYAGLLIALQDNLTFYIWDVIDLSTMLIFAYAIFYAPNSLRLLIPLFFVELLNRESAGYVALWIALSAAGTWYCETPTLSERKALLLQMVVGIGLLTFGTCWTHVLRALLFKHSNDPKIGLDFAHLNGEMFVLFRNLHNFIHPANKSGFAIAIVCCCVIVFMARRLFALHGKKSYPLLSLLVVMMASVWCFGLVAMTRMWLEFIPFVLMFAISETNRYKIVFVGQIERSDEPALSGP